MTVDETPTTIFTAKSQLGHSYAWWLGTFYTLSGSYRNSSTAYTHVPLAINVQLGLRSTSYLMAINHSAQLEPRKVINQLRVTTL